MATPLFSKQINFSLDGSVIAYATDFSMSVNRDMIEIGKMASTVRAKQNIPDLYSYTISGSGMSLRTTEVLSSEYGFGSMMNSLLTSDTSVAWSIIPDVSSQKYYTGYGYFSSLTQEGGVGAAVTYSFELAGDGPIAQNTSA